jgi:O-antigen ligase
LKIFAKQEGLINKERKNVRTLKYNIFQMLLIIYLFLSTFEFYLNDENGSLLKYLGFLIMFWWLLMFFSRETTIKLHIEQVLLIFWNLYGVISLLWSPNLSIGWYYAYSSTNMVVLIILLSCITWENKDKERILFTIQLSTLLASVLLIKNGDSYYGDGIRQTLMIFGQKLDPNNIAGNILPGLIITFSKINLSKKWRLANICVFFVMFYAIILTGSRGGTLASILSLIIFITFNLKMSKKRILNMITIFLILFIGIILFKIFVNPYILQRFSLAIIEQDQGSGRLNLWAIGWSMIKLNPILGYGIGSYSGFTGQGMHNTFLLYWFETGIIGLLLFIISICIILIKLYKKQEYLGFSILAGAIIVICFLDAYGQKFMWMGMLLSTIILRIKKYKEKEYDKVTM